MSHRVTMPRHHTPFRETKPVLTEHGRSHVEEVVRLEQREQRRMGWTDQVANKITGFAGSMLFVALNTVWFIVWIAANAGLFGFEPFDPFPFSFLTMVVSLEAILLTLFVLISQNRQAEQADRRAKVDLQVNATAEQELTKLISMVAQIQDYLGLKGSADPDVIAMTRTTHVSDLADEIDRAEKQIAPESAKGPKSAADTAA